MYSTTRTVIRKSHPLYGYCSDTTSASKLLYNATLYRLRNHYTACSKAELTENEKAVEAELDALEASGFSFKRSRKVLSYATLEKLMRVTNNPDFFCRGLSMQTAQHVVKSAVQDFVNWTKAQKAYDKDSTKFLGKPKMPGYRKSDTRTTELTNQDCTLSNSLLKFPLTDIRLKVDVPEKAKLKSVDIKPYYEDFLVLATYEYDKVITSEDMPYSAGVDFGVDNIAAITTNEGNTLLFKGSVVKAENQYFNKERARLIASLTKGHETKHVSVKSHRLSRLSQHRDSFIRDAMHKTSAHIVAFSKEHRIGTLVIGVSKLWKQNSEMSRLSNQKFVQIPFAELRSMIEYKAEREGIRVVFQEGSYTSKADFLSGDSIPVYGENDADAVFSGRRTKRGLYRSGTGREINADINGAANILRKAVPDAFENVDDFGYLERPRTFRVDDINHRSRPDEGVVAV